MTQRYFGKFKCWADVREVFTSAPEKEPEFLVYAFHNIENRDEDEVVDNKLAFWLPHPTAINGTAIGYDDKARPRSRTYKISSYKLDDVLNDLAVNYIPDTKKRMTPSVALKKNSYILHVFYKTNSKEDWISIIEVNKQAAFKELEASIEEDWISYEVVGGTIETAVLHTKTGWTKTDMFDTELNEEI